MDSKQALTFLLKTASSSVMENLYDDPAIELREIGENDWSWLINWFRDPWLNRELGPLDQAWLQHVINNSDGVELVAEISEQPIGMIGIAWADNTHPFHGITDLAISPKLRRRGLGRRVLKQAMKWPGHPPTKGWIAFVNKENTPSARLLLSVGWREDGIQDGMKRFKYTA